MPFISWDDSMDVGVRVFNEDHRRLVEFINELHSGMVSGLGISKMTYILEGLADYTAKHFGREEDLMRKHSYPAYEEHRLQHQALIEKVAEFNVRLKNGSTSFSLELMGFLKDWLVNHIKGSDMRYRDFFTGLGIS